jgi:hypothetical protein
VDALKVASRRDSLAIAQSAALGNDEGTDFITPESPFEKQRIRDKATAVEHLSCTFGGSFFYLPHFVPISQTSNVPRFQLFVVRTRLLQLKN